MALWVIDPRTDLSTMEESASRLLPLCSGKRFAVLVNKCDIVDAIRISDTMKWAESMIAKHGKGVQWGNHDMWAISAKLGVNMDKLEDFLVDAAAIPSMDADAVIVTNVRHYEALRKALTNIQDVRRGLNDGIPADLVSLDLRACIRHLAEIVGSVSSEDVLINVFKNFCIGK